MDSVSKQLAWARLNAVQAWVLIIPIYVHLLMVNLKVLTKTSADKLTTVAFALLNNNVYSDTVIPKLKELKFLIIYKTAHHVFRIMKLFIVLE